MIHLLRSHATQEQLTAMLEELTEYVKLAVEILDPAIRDRVNVIELVELQRQLAQWQFKWPEIWQDPERRASVAELAGAWSQKILERSGLLKI